MKDQWYKDLSGIVKMNSRALEKMENKLALLELEINRSSLILEKLKITSKVVDRPLKGFRHAGRAVLVGEMG